MQDERRITFECFLYQQNHCRHDLALYGESQLVTRQCADFCNTFGITSQHIPEHWQDPLQHLVSLMKHVYEHGSSRYISLFCTCKYIVLRIRSACQCLPPHYPLCIDRLDTRAIKQNSCGHHSSCCCTVLHVQLKSVPKELDHSKSPRVRL